MSVSIYKIKKWIKMITGKSILHVNQGVGKFFQSGKVLGYYNDLTEKVTKDPETLEKRVLPIAYNEEGKQVVFATTIFQYGLGSYDLFLETNEEKYIDQFNNCVNWACANQDQNGGWDISCCGGLESKYGAMAQGEGASLLLRANKYHNDEKYFLAAKKAIDLMLTPIEKGGTSRYENDEIFLMEFMDKPCVLNGWIFSLFGLYDLTLDCDEEKYKSALLLTLNTLKSHLSDFDCGYWSKYDMDKMIASPFYHKLHIAQLKALLMIDNDAAFSEMLAKFEKYQNSWWNRKRAFIKKACQKVFEK